MELFLARASRGGTFHEFVLGAMIVPSLMCFIWFTVVGGTAIDLTLNGREEDAITGVGISSQLFAMINFLLSPTMAPLMSIAIVVLLLTYLVTSADSAVLIINNAMIIGALPFSIIMALWVLLCSMRLSGTVCAPGTPRAPQTLRNKIACDPGCAARVTSHREPTGYL